MLQQTDEKEAAVSSMLEYTIITALLMLLFLTVTAVSDAAFITGPFETIRSQECSDVADALSVEIVDLAVLTPQQGTIAWRLNLPDCGGVRSYPVQIVPDSVGNTVDILVGDGDGTASVVLQGFERYMPSIEMISRSGAEYVCVESGGEQ